MSARVGDELHAAALRLREAGVESPLLDAQLLMANALRCSRLDLIAHPERSLDGAQLLQFHAMLEKRESRYPLAYILVKKEFYGLELDIEPGVLVPRPETEILIEECLKRVKSASPMIADIGAGSGAIAVAVAMHLPGARVYATEISPAALKVARANVEKHQLADRVNVLWGDLLEPLIGLGLRFDAILSNPPYIPSGDIPSLQPEIRLHEPTEALDGGPDGLDVYRKLIPGALDLLNTGGFVAVEIGVEQAGPVSEIARDAGYGAVEVVRDLAGIERVAIALR